MITEIRMNNKKEGFCYTNKYLYSFNNLETLEVTNTIKKIICEEIEDIITHEKKARCTSEDSIDIIENIKTTLNNEYNAEIIVEDIESIPPDVIYTIQTEYSNKKYLGTYLRIQKRKNLKLHYFYCEEMRTVALIKLHERDLD